jgi:tRNA pseudouridine13 synthase
MTSLRDKGFINYFGMQRFGTSTVPTFLMGRYILHSDWRGAIDAILMPRPGEPEDLTEAREHYIKTRDAQGALNKLPGGHPLEKILLQELVKREGSNDYLGALKCIPFSSRLLYVHSYQSLVWNRVVTHRIREHGLVPIPGDLVPGHGNKPQVITEETLSQYTIHDVLLPLPGCDIRLPDNSIGEKYEAILGEDNLTLQQFNHKVKEFTLYGSYRHIVVKPKDVEWDVLMYNDVTVPLALTDCDLLDNKPTPESIEGGQFKAIRMSFSLPTACYATMAIRELVKMETSSHYQAQLNPHSGPES